MRGPAGAPTSEVRPHECAGLLKILDGIQQLEGLAPTQTRDDPCSRVIVGTIVESLNRERYGAACMHLDESPPIESIPWILEGHGFRIPGSQRVIEWRATGTYDHLIRLIGGRIGRIRESIDVDDVLMTAEIGRVIVCDDRPKRVAVVTARVDRHAVGGQRTRRIHGRVGIEAAGGDGLIDTAGIDEIIIVGKRRLVAEHEILRFGAGDFSAPFRGR
jgi:hypothetical protein